MIGSNGTCHLRAFIPETYQGFALWFAGELP
jgi:hypothetical protein